jgi:hypothetical protein
MATLLSSDTFVGIEPCPQDPAEPYVIAHCFASPPIHYLLYKLTIPLLGLAAIVALVATAIPMRKIIAGAAASVLALFLGLTIFQVPVAVLLGVPWMDPTSAAPMVGIASLLFGVIASWASLKWWPNKSFERTRDR